MDIPVKKRSPATSDVKLIADNTGSQQTGAKLVVRTLEAQGVSKFWCRALVKTNYNCLGELKPFVSCRSSRKLFNRSRFMWIRHALVNQFVPDSRGL